MDAESERSSDGRGWGLPASGLRVAPWEVARSPHPRWFVRPALSDEHNPQEERAGAHFARDNCRGTDSRSQHDLDVDAVGNLDPHQLPQRAFVRIEVDEPLVDPHLPAVPCLAPFAVGRLAHRHHEPFRRERDRPGHRDPGAFADQLDLLANIVDLLRVRAAERDPRLLSHTSTWWNVSRGLEVTLSY